MMSNAFAPHVASADLLAGLTRLQPATGPTIYDVQAAVKLRAFCPANFATLEQFP